MNDRQLRKIAEDLSDVSSRRDKNLRGASSWFDAIAALIAIGAGIYLLSEHSVAGSNSWFQVIGHGMGAYFIAKGIFLGRSLHLQSRTVELLAGISKTAEADIELEHGAKLEFTPSADQI